MTPSQYQARREAGDALLLVDVREAWELDVANVPGTVHIPMGDIPRCLAELDPDAQMVILCRSGARSGQVASFLQQKGYQAVWNLKGGILAWSDEIDPNIPKY